MSREFLLLRERFLLLPFILSTSLFLGGVWYLILKYPYLPPEVPLWYSLPWGAKQLATPFQLSLLPVLSLLLLFLNLFLTEIFLKKREQILAYIAAWFAFLNVFLLNFALYQIASAVAIPSTLPPLLRQEVFLPMAATFLAALLITPFTLKLSEKWGLIDNPKTHRHPAMLLTKPTPRAGALPAFMAVVLISLFFVTRSDVLFGLLIAGALTTFTGLLDDKFDLNPYLRLGAQVLAIIIVILAGVHINYIGHPLSRGFLPLDLVDLKFELFGLRHFYLPGDLLTVFWGVFMMNMLSWSNGVDGQFPGMVGITAITIGLLGERLAKISPPPDSSTLFAFITAGGILGTLPFAWHPSRFLYGFGATTFGLFLAALAILSVAKVGLTLLILSVPALDALFTITRRLRRGQSPVWGDRGHLHHKLLDLGWSQRGIAVFYWGITAFLGTVALYASAKDELTALLSGAALASLVLIFANLERGFPKRLIEY